MRVRLVAVVAAAALVTMGTACKFGDPTACAMSAEALQGACQAPATARLRNDVAGSCSADGNYKHITKEGELGGRCDQVGSCEIVCLVQTEDCPCGLDYYDDRGVQCITDCPGSCGDMRCDYDDGETPMTCPGDCGPGSCIADVARCNGDTRQICDHTGVFEDVPCPTNTLCAGKGQCVEENCEATCEGVACGAPDACGLDCNDDTAECADGGICVDGACATEGAAGSGGGTAPGPEPRPPEPSSPADQPGHDQETALVIGDLAEPWERTNEFVDEDGDYYRLHLLGNATVNYAAEIRGDSGRITIQVFENAPTINVNVPYDSASAQSSAPANKDIVLEKGTYYFRVIRVGANARYDFSMSADLYDPAEPDTDPGEDKDDAMALDLTRPIKVGGYVGRTDSADYYSFMLASPQTVQLSATDVAGRVFVQLFDDAITLDENAPTVIDANNADGFHSPDLDSGRYYIRVYASSSGMSLYTLNANVATD